MKRSTTTVHLPPPRASCMAQSGGLFLRKCIPLMSREYYNLLFPIKYRLPLSIIRQPFISPSIHRSRSFLKFTEFLKQEIIFKFFVLFFFVYFYPKTWWTIQNMGSTTDQERLQTLQKALPRQHQHRHRTYETDTDHPHQASYLLGRHLFRPLIKGGLRGDRS